MDASQPSETNPRLQKLDKVLLLAQCPLFSGLSHWELQSISQLMRLVEFKKDEMVYREGENAHAFYVVVLGRFEASASVNTKKDIYAYLKRGDYFGEMSLLTREPHSASIRALSDSLVLELKKEDFERTIEHNATVSMELSRRLSARLKGGEARIRSLFKSDIIAIYGIQPRSGQSLFSVNLAASLCHETHQKTLLVDIQSTANGGNIPLMPDSSKRISLSQFQNIESRPTGISGDILWKHPGGFDVLSLSAGSKDSAAADLITPLLNQLAVDYRFVLLDLPQTMNEMVFKAMTQSDLLYFITDSSMNNIMETKELVSQIEKEAAISEDRISVVINEAFLGVRTGTVARKELFGKKLCFSLPALSLSSENRDLLLLPRILEEPDSEYSRVVRHIARHISHNLVGLVLGSGAALGLAHIGVLKVLEREKIPVDIISGSSIGALIASFYAVGKTAAEIEATAMEIQTKMQVMQLMDPCIPPVKGLIRGNRIMRHFKKNLGDKTFEHCRIPLKITGANLSTRQVQIFDSGYIWEAVRTSIAIPAILRPTFLNNDVIVDGGILSPLPIRALRQAGANKIIAINVFPSPKDVLEKRILKEEADEKEAMQIRQRHWMTRSLYGMKRYFAKKFSSNMFDILMNTIQAMESEIADVEGQAADVLLRPVLPTASWAEFYKPEPFIRCGEEEAMKHLSKIKELVSQQTN